MEGWYYLHTNGELIYKRGRGGTAADIRDSDFARALWPMDPRNRENAWQLLVEASAAGANPARIKELAEKWKCDDEDADNYAARVGVKLLRDGNQWMAVTEGFIDMMETPSGYGFGTTKLEAFAELAKALGYKPSKMWGATFKDLVKGVRA